MKKVMLYLVMFSFCFSLIMGCTAKIITKTPKLKGTYSGRTSDGQPVTFTLMEKESAFAGRGTLKGERVNVSGLTIWRGIGSIINSDGTKKMVSWQLSPDSERLIIQGLEEPLVLSRGGSPLHLTPGPLSGYYKAEGEGLPLVDARIIQDGELFHGMARVYGDTTAIAGRLLSPDSAEGVIIYRDKSQRRFKVKISDDRSTLEIIGLGKPVILKKRP